MVEMLERFADASFIDALSGFAPLVLAGFLLGTVVAVVGWAVGFVVHFGKLDL